METFSDFYIKIILSIYFIGFIIKSLITARRTNQSIRGKSWKNNLVVINSIILGMVAFTKHLDSFFWIKLLDLTIVKIIGLVFVTLACAIGISTLITMKNSWRVGIQPEQKTDLINNGLFKYSRNPFFLSFNLLFLGIFLESPTLVYLMFYFSFIIILHFIIMDEEKHLLQQHGDSYRNYKNSVNRYFTIRLRNKR